MSGRGPQSFKKRQKEQQRKEKQQEKMAKRLERKRQGPNPSTEEEPEATAAGDEQIADEQIADRVNSDA